MSSRIQTQTKTTQTSVTIAASLMVAVSSVAMFFVWGMMLAGTGLMDVNGNVNVDITIKNQNVNKNPQGVGQIFQNAPSSDFILDGREYQGIEPIDFNSEEIKSLPEDLKEVLRKISPEKQSKLNEELKDIREQIRKRGLLWEADFNPKFILDDEVKKKMMGVKVGGNTIKDKKISLNHESGNYNKEQPKILGEELLPDFFDWRDRRFGNVITPVRDQQECGSCWAFATVGVIEGVANALYNNNLKLDLSEQELVSCFKGDGCSGIYDFEYPKLFDYIINNGVVNEWNFWYKNADINSKTKNYLSV